MNCDNCGGEISENMKFCPKCGKEILKAEQIDVDSGEEYENEAFCNENTKMNIRSVRCGNKLFSIIKVLFSLLTVFLMFNVVSSLVLNGNIKLALITIIVFFIIVILATKYEDNKIAEVVSIPLVFFLIYAGRTAYINRTTVEVVKNSVYCNSALSYEDAFNNFSETVKWECTDNKKFTIVSTGNYGGCYDGKVTVRGGCFYYDKETEYEIEFYVSRSTKTAKPVNLYLEGVQYTADALDEFLMIVFGMDYSTANIQDNENTEFLEDEGVLDGSYIKIKDYTMSNGENGACINITYEFVNGSGKANAFYMLFSDYVFQNGIECEPILECLKDSQLEIQPGYQTELTMIYQLHNVTDPVTINISPYLYNKPTIVKTINLI